MKGTNTMKDNLQFVTVRIACPKDVTEAEIADAINETLNRSNVEFPGNSIFADWAIEIPATNENSHTTH